MQAYAEKSHLEDREADGSVILKLLCRWMEIPRDSS
jgi:hypothetical protein